MKNIVVFDLDGTLTDPSHRLHYVENIKKKDWGSFFKESKNDAPKKDIISLCNTLSQIYDIHILTGRSDEVRDSTRKWLSQNAVNYDRLVMRPADSRVSDIKLKSKWIIELLKDYKIVMAFDDRMHMFELWKSFNIPVCYIKNN